MLRLKTPMSTPTVVVFSAQELQDRVCSHVDHRVERTAFYKWRAQLGLINRGRRGFTAGEESLLKVFASYVANGASLEAATDLTFTYIKGLKNNV